MSFSVDDLVASLNSSHIGQEAMDLAALQAQLAATLFSTRTPRAVAAASASHHQPCNTPLARTPSNSISMGSVSIDMTMSMRTSASSRRGSYSTPHHAYVHSHARNDMPISSAPAPPPPSAYHHHHHHYYHYQNTLSFDDEDERMVEELLLPPPSSAFHYETAGTSLPPPNTAPSSSSSSSSTSFTTSDPFYLSQLQASQQAFAPNPATSQSLFAQNGRITQGSQFALQTAF